MEVKTTPSLYGDRVDERGLGGKLGKAQPRKRPATPYDRPPVNLASRGASSWWSKLGDPAYRLVSGATKMILPYFFTKSPALLPSTETEPEDKLDLEVIPNAKDDDPCTSSYDVPKFTERTEPSEVASDRLKTTCETEGHGQDRLKNLNDDSELSRIEQLIKGKTFSRDEIIRFTEILNSKVCNPSEIDGEKTNEVTTTLGHTAGVKLTPFPGILDEGNQEDMSRAILRTPKPLLYADVNAQDDVGASPVDIAKAYMGSRMLDPGPGSHNGLSKGETTMQPNDEFVMKPFTPSYSQKSSTCWPGAMVQDPHGYITPSQRGRYGLHDFPRTPYSRTIYSKSRSKLTQLQADSIHQTTSSKAFPQFQTTIFGQVKSRTDVLDNSYGSVGPIRHVRNKFASEARTRGSILLKPSKDASSPFQQPSVSKGFLPTLEKNLEPGETSKWPGDNSGNRFQESVPLLNPSSSQAVKKILEQLDNKPTPKEKAAELKLATSWRESPHEASHSIQKENISSLDSGKFGSLKNTDSVEPIFLSEENKVEGNSNGQVKFQKRSMEAEDAVVKSSKTSGVVIGNSGTTNGVNAGTSFSQMKSFQQEASVGIKNVTKEISPNLSLCKQSNGQRVITVSSESHFEPSKKAIAHCSGSKPVLPHISVGRRDPRRTVNSENGAGFTFPVSSSSSVLSEPSTPSFMPFSSSSMVSHSKEVPTVPSYSFGTEKSAPRLVFSFPSTSSAPNHVDALDPKFNFGSDEKPRLSFGSVGKDAICN